MEWAWAGYLAIGATAGLAAGFLGIGGGLIIVPALIALFALTEPNLASPVHSAIATSLATILFTAPGAILAHHRKGAVSYALVLRFLPGLLLGAGLGAWMATHVAGRWLALGFGLYALLAGLRMLLPLAPKPSAGRKNHSDQPLSGLELAPAGAVIGFVSSMVGIGGGSLTVPWLSWRGLAMPRAIAVSAVCGYPIALGGVVGYLLFAPAGLTGGAFWGYIQPAALLGIVIASVPAAPLGANWMHRLPVAGVRRVFAVFLLIVAARMLVFS